MPVVYLCGAVSVSSLGYFSSVGYSSKPSQPSFPLYLRARHIQDYSKKKSGRKRKFINPQQDKAIHEKLIKRTKVIVRENFVVGYWELIPMESGAELSSPQDIATVRVTKEIPSAKNQRTAWYT